MNEIRALDGNLNNSKTNRMLLILLNGDRQGDGKEERMKRSSKEKREREKNDNIKDREEILQIVFSWISGPHSYNNGYFHNT